MPHPKTTAVAIRLQTTHLDRIRREAKRCGVDEQVLVRMAINCGLSQALAILRRVDGSNLRRDEKSSDRLFPAPAAPSNSVRVSHTKRPVASRSL